jgi:hypothetical protein
MIYTSTLQYSLELSSTTSTLPPALSSTHQHSPCLFITLQHSPALFSTLQHSPALSYPLKNYPALSRTLLFTITNQYNKISKYMVANKLVINDDKTHLVVMAKQGQGSWYHCRQENTPSYPLGLLSYLVHTYQKISNGRNVF